MATFLALEKLSLASSYAPLVFRRGNEGLHLLSVTAWRGVLGADHRGDCPTRLAVSRAPSTSRRLPARRNGNGVVRPNCGLMAVDALVEIREPSCLSSWRGPPGLVPLVAARTIPRPFGRNSGRNTISAKRAALPPGQETRLACASGFGCVWPTYGRGNRTTTVSPVMDATKWPGAMGRRASGEEAIEPV